MKRDVSRVERDVTLGERDVSRVEGDVSRDERDITLDERNVSRDKRDVTLGERDVSRGERDVTHDERDVTRDERDISWGKRDVFRGERDVFRGSWGLLINCMKKRREDEEVLFKLVFLRFQDRRAGKHRFSYIGIKISFDTFELAIKRLFELEDHSGAEDVAEGQRFLGHIS